MTTLYVRPCPVSTRNYRCSFFPSRGVLLRFHRLNNRVGEFRGAGGAAHVAGQFAAVAVDLVDGVADLEGGVVLAKMAQHQQRRSQNCGGISDIPSGDVRCGAVHRFKDGALVAEIRARYEAKSADQPGAQVGKNYALEFLPD